MKNSALGLLMVVTLMGCSGGNTGTDTRVDASADTTVDVARPDVTIDAPSAGDSANDVLPDTRSDVSTDVRPEVGDGACTDFTEATLLADQPPSHAACNPCREPRNAGLGSESGQCMLDSDCNQGINGRCVFARFGTQCSYDQCLTDSDCPSGSTCVCGGTGGAANRCMPVFCDSCAAGQTCAPSFGSCGTYSGFVEYRCHTAQDACHSDSDCPAATPANFCAYDPTVSHWACSNLSCAG